MMPTSGEDLNTSGGFVGSKSNRQMSRTDEGEVGCGFAGGISVGFENASCWGVSGDVCDDGKLMAPSRRAASRADHDTERTNATSLPSQSSSKCPGPRWKAVLAATAVSGDPFLMHHFNCSGCMSSKGMPASGSINIGSCPAGKGGKTFAGHSGTCSGCCWLWAATT